MKFEVIVRAIVIVHGKVLLHRNIKRNQFALPGGHIEVGENMKESLVRELKEETGLDIRVGRLVYINENFFEQAGQEFHEIGFYFLADVLGKVPEKIESKEGHIDFRFVDLKELPQTLLHPSFLRTALPEDHSKGFSGPVGHTVQRGHNHHLVQGMPEK